MTSTRSSREERQHNPFRRVFFWQLRANRIGALCFTLCLLIALPAMQLMTAYFGGEFGLPLPAAVESSASASALDSLSAQMAKTLHFQLLCCLLPLSIAFILFYCISAFGFMHRRGSVDLFHSLPVRRTPLLMGSFVAGLVYLYVPIILSLALCQCIGLYYGLSAPYNTTWVLESFLLCLLMLTAIYTSSLFFCVVSGALADAAISILALNLGWPLLCVCVYQIICRTLPEAANSFSLTLATAFAPYLAAFVPLIDSNYLFDPAISTFILWWAALIVVFLLGSIFFYRRRKSECAESHLAFPVIRGVLRLLISAASGLALGLVLGRLLNSNLLFLTGVVAGSAIAHTVSQLIWTRSFRRFWTTIPAYVLTLCCLFAFLFVPACLS